MRKRWVDQVFLLAQVERRYFSLLQGVGHGAMKQFYVLDSCIE